MTKVKGYARYKFYIRELQHDKEDGYYIKLTHRTSFVFGKDVNYLKEHNVKDTILELVHDDDIGFIKEWNSIETLYISNEGVYCYMDNKRHFVGVDIILTKLYTLDHNGNYINQDINI